MSRAHSYRDIQQSSFSNLSVTSPTSQLILIFQALSLHLRHSSFSNPSLALPTSKHILQPFRCFTYITAHSPTLLLLLLRHRIFTYVTWRAAHAVIWQSALPHSSCSPWKHFCVLRPHASTILIQEHCSSFVNMVLGHSHYSYESQCSTHCSRLTEYSCYWLH